MIFKELAAGAVVVADIVFGTALPKALSEMHKQAHPNYAGVIALYGVLGILTLIVIVSVVRALGAKAAANNAPAPRPTYSSFRGGR